MRRLLLLPLALALLTPDPHGPEFQHDAYSVGGAGPGRGLVNPPTIYEMHQSKCLATMVYGEARGEARKGMVAVAYTALNRARNKTVCDVVLAPKQYSIFNDNPVLRAAAMSGNLDPKQKNVIDNAGWAMAKDVADTVIRGTVPDPTKGATHYLADKVMLAKGYKYPKWSKEFKLVVTIDNHKFYKPVDKKVASL